MFPQFGATAESLSKASTAVFRIGTDAHLYDDPEDVNIAPLLDSRFDSEKCEALKRLLALIAQGFDVSNFFPQVVKNVASSSLEVKKLVYLYLLHYAEKRPNEALLSINYFQKDLVDTNPLVRAWALRAMAGIRLHAIASLVLVAVGKCARDPSVYVRKCAANALPKLHDLRMEEHASAIEEIVGLLLNDHSPGVVGAAASAFTSVCPNNFSLIGRNYKKLCEILPDVEEWGQIMLIGILLRYVIARHGLVKESIMFSLNNKDHRNLDEDEHYSTLKEDVDYAVEKSVSELAQMIFQCYIEGPDEYLSRSSSTIKVTPKLDESQYTSFSNEVVKILLQCTSPLLWSHNSAVVLAAAGVHWIMAPKEDVKRIVKPLLFVLRSSYASRYVVLCNIQVFAKAMPSLFAPHYEDFFIYTADSYQIKALKLEILSIIASEASIPFILKEFQDYIRDPDRRFAADTIASIGLCAQRLPKMATTCLEGLSTLIRQESLCGEIRSLDGEEGVLIQAIMSIISIIKLEPPSYEKVIIQLVRSLDTIKVPAARAMIVWLLGEYGSLGEIIPRMLSTVLKYLAWCFTSEGLETKLQILNTITKLLPCIKGEDSRTLRKIWTYIIELAERDLNYDIRDRSRFLKKLLSSNLESQNVEEENDESLKKDQPSVLAECIFGGQTKTVTVPSEPINGRFYLPGSLSQIVFHAAPGYEPLPKPCSLPYIEQYDGAVKSDSGEVDDPGTSGSSDDENDSAYSSEQSISGSSEVSGSNETVSGDEGDNNDGPLIQISDTSNVNENQNGGDHSGTSGFSDLMSTKSLESWLDEPSKSSKGSETEQSQVRRSSARITIGNIGSRIKPKYYTLLDPANGNGLLVNYSFSSETSSISSHLVCLELLFENCSLEPMFDIVLIDEDSSQSADSTEQISQAAENALKSHIDKPALISMEAIPSLDPGQKDKRTLLVRFHHHLLPLKLALFCNDKKFPVKLRPDIGYFVKPLSINIEDFRDKESHLPGMFEYVRSCTFNDHMRKLNKESNSPTEDTFIVICETIALKMLSNANLSLVSVDLPVASNLDDASGLCLRFSSEILSNSMPCLITVTVEGKCSDPLTVSVKVNCEETVFGLNFLNRIVNFLAEPPVTNL
ncbi:AP3-complex subunit beta-A [Lathyrus oleraceus]|uniref:AP-3 complex subunit beta n=2 Tax=Pisum sativum TaxID=3888 RepID=A0A9D4YC13_PEA|nr:AP3-complex subunit beta-A [Pisum sativum]KAI5434445.1 AP3-complex subunit beta-A [Pisum sativum]